MTNRFFTNLRPSLSNYILVLLGFLLVSSCREKASKRALFETLSPEQTGITFSNILKPTPDLNILTYLYYYNGGGVACGDLNGDKLPDLYFTANQNDNQLYLNQGDLKFENITEVAGVNGSQESWTTGVCMADVNGDGKLDIYVSELGNYNGIFGKNKLYINQGNNEQGIPTFKESAKQYGLDLVGLSTQAAFFDMDRDGDLDMYQLNHSVHNNGTFRPLDSLRYKKHKLAGDRLLRNDNGKFVDVTDSAGIFSSALGYGLAISIGDVNQDGWPDIYVGNDFHENDYLYINQQNGTFQESIEKYVQHTSRFSMGNDLGDFNNDGLTDILSLDMLPYDYQILKASAAENPFDVYHHKLRFGYNYQFSRNTLQLNRGGNMFSEIGAFSGIYATDWSWAALIADYDLDGKKDVFISNGIKRRPNDLDYLKYISSDAIQYRLAGKLEDQDLALIEEMPEMKLPNFLFRNNGGLQFENVAPGWNMDQASYSQGAIYADLDNDGDLDLVTNNTDDPAFVYKNLTRELQPEKSHYLKIQFKGSGQNPLGIGAKVVAETSHGIISQELYTTRGFQSSVNPEMILGLGTDSLIKSLTVIWPDARFQTLNGVKADQTLTLEQNKADGKYNFNKKSKYPQLFTEIPEELILPFLHKENNFVEFNRESLIPHMASREGPALALGDANGDGQVDIFIGGAKNQKAGLFFQSEEGWEQIFIPVLDADSVQEDVSAKWIDVDKDDDLDLIVISGGNEFWGESDKMLPRLYRNDGKGNLEKDPQAFAGMYLTGDCLASADYDQDGDVDLFIGARALPWNYGLSPKSYLLQNDGKGNFSDITAEVEGLSELGMVKDAHWADLNQDGFLDLTIVGEWFPITIFQNQSGVLNKLPPTITGLDYTEGFWNAVNHIDIDQDGDMDLVIGNMGLNSKLKASRKEPLSLQVCDLDGDSRTECIMYYYHDGEKRIFATKDELAESYNDIKKNFVSYQKYSQTDTREIIPSEKLKGAQERFIYELRNCVLINQGDFRFEIQALPDPVQYSTVNFILKDDFNGDKQEDILLGGNFYEVNVQIGRYDASYGSLLLSQKGEKPKLLPNPDINLRLNGQIRSAQSFEKNGQKYYIFARNNQTVQMLKGLKWSSTSP